MTIESDLTAFVVLYSPFDKEKKYYTEQLDNAKLQILGSRFRQWINHQLLADGTNKKNVEKNYKALSKYFHTDRITLAEAQWLEQQLSEGTNDGSCFKILSSSYQKLMEPAKFKDIEFNGINCKEDCRLWLEKLKSQSDTYSHRTLCDSLIGLLNESHSFFDATGKVKPNAIKTLVQFIPAVIAGYGSILIIEELLAIYALYFILLKAEAPLRRSNYSELKEVGRFLKNYNHASAMLLTSVLARILEMIFWSSRQSFNATIQIGSALLAPLLPAPAEAAPDIEMEQLAKDLVLAGEHKKTGMQFDTPELKIIAAPFEKYLALNEQQFFGIFRVGNEKRKQVSAFLFRLRILDQMPGSLEEKYSEVLSELALLKKNKQVYTSNTAFAVDYTEHMVKVLQSPNIVDMQLGEQLSTDKALVLT